MIRYLCSQFHISLFFNIILVKVRTKLYMMGMIETFKSNTCVSHIVTQWPTCHNHHVCFAYIQHITSHHHRKTWVSSEKLNLTYIGNSIPWTWRAFFFLIRALLSNCVGGRVCDCFEDWGATWVHPDPAMTYKAKDRLS